MTTGLALGSKKCGDRSVSAVSAVGVNVVRSGLRVCVLLHEVQLTKLSGCVAPGESHPLLGVLRVAVRNVTDGQMNET